MTERTISKVLIAQEDLALGQGSTSQTRQGISQTVNQIDLPWCVTSLVNLKALDVAKYKHTILDTGAAQLLYRYDAASTATADDYNYVLPDSTIGRWILVIDLTDVATSYESLASFVAATPTNSMVKIRSYYGGWAATIAGPKGGHYRHKTGYTNASPSVGTAVSVSSIGGGDGSGLTTGQSVQAGLCWDADGNEWALVHDTPFVQATTLGVKADGVTNDIAASRDTVTYATAKGINWGMWPEGTIRHNARLEIPQKFRISGVHRNKTQFSVESAVGIYAANSLNGTFDIFLENFSLAGNSSGASNHGIHFVGDLSVNVGRVVMNSVAASSFGGNGFYIDRPIITALNSCLASNNGNYGFYIDGDGTSTYFENCWAQTNTSDGYRIDGVMQYCEFSCCAADGNGGAGYRLEGSIATPAECIVFNGCGAEVNLGNNFHITAALGVTFNSVKVYPGATPVGGDSIFLDGCRYVVINGTRITQAAAAGKYNLNIGTLGGTQFPTATILVGSTFGSINNAGTASQLKDLNNAEVSTNRSRGSVAGYNGLNVAHGLGVTPSHVTVTVESNSIYGVGVDSKDATNFRLLLRDSAGALVTSGSPVNLTWEAIK